MNLKKDKAKMKSYIRLHFKNLEKEVATLGERTIRKAKAKGGKDGANNNPAFDSNTPKATHTENEIKYECKQVEAKINSSLKQYRNQESVYGIASGYMSMSINKETTQVTEISLKEQEVELRTNANKTEILEDELKELELEKQALDSEMASRVSTIDRIPLPQVWRKVGYYLLMIAFSCGEMAINFTALSNMSYSLSRFSCFLLSVFFCVVCGLSSHFTGKIIAEVVQKELPKKHLIPAFFAFVPSVLILVVVFILRSNESDGFLVLVNLALVLIATIIAYFHTDPFEKEIAEYLGYKAARVQLDKKIVKVKEQLLELRNTKEQLLSRVRISKNERHKIDVSDEVLEMTIKQIEEYLRELLIRLHAIYKGAIETYRHANVDARIARGIPLVEFWDEDDNDLPELDKAPISPKL